MEQVKPKKNLGQNFLLDKEIVSLIVESADILLDDLVIEPGSGTGIVTEKLIETGAQIIGVEIDKDLIPALKERFKSKLNFQLESNSVLDASFGSLVGGKAYKVVGSIPYQISSPLIHKILFENIRPSIVCIVLQKEVAEKIVGGVGQGTYMSSMVELFYDSQIVKIIGPEAFNPAPKVHSALLLLTLKPIQPVINLKKFKGFLHKAFSNRRKMLNKTFSTDELQQAGINPTARPQELTLTQLINLYHKT
ncbi:MAG: 16S rRNA (adenine(1518)-N(6)/adenine(1519)-N(6))-dimethyltransferase RsmA [bacterium]|nr:16S rRNA (adenine(1518)-N(6)/adenine(1519)-N(6))-dimethyltransferase RsmA [bacterium]